MMKKLTLALLLLGLLTSCASTELSLSRNIFAKPNMEKIKNMEPINSLFSKTLYKGYLELGDLEYAEDDFIDGSFFYAKASLAAQGEKVLPEEIENWNLSTTRYWRPVALSDFEELVEAKEELQLLLTDDLIMKNPVQVAEAQVAFDCWIQELEENHQPEHVNECKNKFYQEIAETNEASLNTESDEGLRLETDVIGDSSLFTIYFEWDSDQISSDNKVINTILESYSTQDSIKIIIDGHTDTSGTVEYNYKLGLRRANKVANAMVGSGINSDQMLVTSYGENKLKVLTADGVRESQNRRVEVFFSAK